MDYIKLGKPVNPIIIYPKITRNIQKRLGANFLPWRLMALCGSHGRNGRQEHHVVLPTRQAKPWQILTASMVWVFRKRGDPQGLDGLFHGNSKKWMI